MNRRGFLSLLGLAPLALAAPRKSYAFFGDILRPRRVVIATASELRAALKALPKGGTIYISSGVHIFGEFFEVPSHFNMFGSIATEPAGESAMISGCVFSASP